MRKTYYILTYIAAVCLGTGYLFRLMHWPYGSELLIAAIAIALLGVLPLYLVNRYKNKP
jgi:hypothetical protein